MGGLVCYTFGTFELTISIYYLFIHNKGYIEFTIFFSWTERLWYLSDP